MTITIYHNPRCSKSRQTLQLLRDHGHEPEIVEYLKTPPSVDELRRIIQSLRLPVRDVVRTGEAPYKDLNLDAADDETLLKAMHEHPILIQRPIVLHGDRGIIGRPPEGVIRLI
ncbi:MAG: arsenate reductase (glutaredoxin) [Wenzhouxiangellaceae bacterium]